MAYGHSGPTETGSWGRANGMNGRVRGGSTSSFRSLPPLSASSNGTVSGSSQGKFRARGVPGLGLVECDGCQSVVDSAGWSGHKRSCRAYGRREVSSSLLGGHAHHHSHSQPVAVLPPLITTTSPTSEISHAKPIGLRYESSPGSTPKISASRSDGLLGHRLEPPPRLSIDTSFSSGGRNSLIDAALGGETSTTLTAHLDRSHISYGSVTGSNEQRHEGRSGGLVRREVHVDQSPTSTKSGEGSVVSSGRVSLKIADLCHPGSPPPARSPDSERSSRRSAEAVGMKRRRSSSPNRARSWTRDGRYPSGSRYPPRPLARHQSSEDNSTTPTHTPLIRTTLSTGSILSRGLDDYDVDSDDEGSSGSLDIRAVRYNYSQSRSTFQSEFDSEDDEPRKEVTSFTHRSYPRRTLSPPSPYISDV